MAKWCEIDQEGLEEWISSRPPVIQEMVRTYPPDRLYRMQSTGQRVTIVSYSEERTVTVTVSGEFNFTLMDREVFGVKIDDLVECDLPGPEELRGSMNLTVEEMRALHPMGTS